MLVSQVSLAQEGIAVYSDYLSDNYYLLHPSMAGAANCAKVRLTARQQWFGHAEAPQLQTLTFNTKIGEDTPSAMGVTMFNDKNGFHAQKGAKITYAHHIKFNYGNQDLNRLSFGLSAGLFQTTLDQTRFTSEAIGDPSVGNGMLVKGSDFNVDFGMSYFYGEFYFHGTVRNALEQKRDIYSEYESYNLRKYIASVGYVFGEEDRVLLEPSLMFQYTEFTKGKTLDINLKAYKNFDQGKFWGGISYRNGFDGTEYMTGGKVADQTLQYITPFIGVNVNNFMVSYTYSHVMGDMTYDSGGFHQITLGFDFWCKKDRWHCNCPATN